MKRLLTALLAALALVAVASTGASADQSRARSAPMLLGVMDDALLGNRPDLAFPAVQQLHPQVIRYDLSWAHTAPRKPADATNPEDPAYDWSLVDQVVIRADALGVPVLLTIEVTPRWAGGGTGNKPPVNMSTLQAFAYAAATRYSGQHIVPSTGQVLPAVTRWEAWNEPNTTSHLTPQYSCRCASAVPVAPTIYAKILRVMRACDRAAQSTSSIDTSDTSRPSAPKLALRRAAALPVSFGSVRNTRQVGPSSGPVSWIAAGARSSSASATRSGRLGRTSSGGNRTSRAGISRVTFSRKCPSRARRYCGRPDRRRCG